MRQVHTRTDGERHQNVSMRIEIARCTHSSIRSAEAPSQGAGSLGKSLAEQFNLQTKPVLTVFSITEYASV